MLDIIGKLWKSTGEYILDEDGGECDFVDEVPGFHVNSTKPVPEWDAFAVVPAAPSRVFGGHVTYFYSFPYEATFLTAQTAAGLAPQE